MFFFFFFLNLLRRVLAARREYAIRSVPNPLEFFGYVYCFSSILAGPAFEYTLYDKATSGEAYRKVSFASLSSSHYSVYYEYIYILLV